MEAEEEEAAEPTSPAVEPPKSKKEKKEKEKKEKEKKKKEPAKKKKPSPKEKKVKEKKEKEEKEISSAVADPNYILRAAEQFRRGRIVRMLFVFLSFFSLFCSASGNCYRHQTSFKCLYTMIVPR